jgi:multiple sugar transport system substrate-binding protein
VLRSENDKSFYASCRRLTPVRGNGTGPTSETSMTATRTLRGVAWAHTRATGPLHVTAQAFADLNPGVEITWSARSLWAFGEAKLDSLARDYDLIVLDHPMIGYAVEQSLLVALDDHVQPGWLEAQADGGVGRSHASYSYNGQQWAAAIDAACPVSVWRADLMRDAGVTPPASWSEMTDLAQTTGRVAAPLKPIDSLSLFLTLCANQGPAPLDTATGAIVAEPLGLQVLDQMSELVRLVGSHCLDLDPIGLLTAMTTSDRIFYCPHAYGYTNYARAGYAPERVTFGPFAGPADPREAGTTLGGAGLAISSRCRDLDLAADYLQWIAGAECQRSTYVLAGGQPGHGAAWDDPLANEITGQFFRQTRATLEQAYVRPRHPGMPAFQAEAASLIHAHLRGECEAASTLERLADRFQQSLVAGSWSIPSAEA